MYRANKTPKAMRSSRLGRNLLNMRFTAAMVSILKPIVIKRLTHRCLEKSLNSNVKKENRWIGITTANIK